MKNLLYLLLITVVFISSCKKDDIKNPKSIIIVKSENITQDETWYSENIYQIQGSVDINSNAVVTIEAGTIIKFESNAAISIARNNGYGIIRSNGTAENPILFTSNGSVKNAGDWNGLLLYNGASGSNFKYCHFEYGGGQSELYGMVHLKETEAAFTNCRFTNSSNYGLSLDDEAGLTSFDYNTFNNCFRNPILLYAQDLHNLGTGNSFQENTNILVKKGDINVSGTFIWKNQGVPYDLSGTIKIGSPSGTTVEIEAGTVINFSSNSEIKVALTSGNFGVLKAIGTATNPIIFSSASPYPAAGDWNGLWFFEGTGTGTSLEYCNISYGGGSYFGGNIFISDDVGANINISNSTISNSENFGIFRKYINYNLPVLTNVNFNSNPSGDYN